MDELLATDELEPRCSGNSMSLPMMSRCTPSIAGSLRSRRRCGGWARWSRAAPNRRRWSAPWPRKCAGAWARSPPECGALRQATRLRWWAPLPIPLQLAKWPVGTRTPIEGNTLATSVQRTGVPARIDSYENIAGSVAAQVRAVGVRAAVGVPVIVDGSVRGLAAVGSAGTWPHAGRHRDAHQRLRRTCRECLGGRIPR